MSNPSTPYGFKYDGLVDGLEPNFGIYFGTLGNANTHSIYQGDVAILSSGNFDVASATGNTGAAFSGIFIDFDWLSISAGMRVRNRAWLGQTGDLVVAGGVTSSVNCRIAIGSNLILQARVTGASNNPITQAMVGNFVNFALGSGPGNNLVSTFSVDATTETSSSSTLPFKIYKIIQPPASDPTSINNDILVAPANYVLP